MSTDRPTSLRVFVIGCSGSGKTTLARLIAERFGVPLHELDFIAWDREGDGSLLPHERRVEIASEISQGDGWVAEGIYLGWTTTLMERADLVVWTDVRLRTALWRIFWRHVKAELRRDNQFPGWRRLVKFMRLVSDQYRGRSTVFEAPDVPISPGNIQRHVEPFESKLMRGSGQNFYDQVIAALESQNLFDER